MATAEFISSLQNPRVKNVVRLGSRRHRDRLQQTVVEGVREVSLALQSGILPSEAFICPEYLLSAKEQEVARQLAQLATEGHCRLFEVPPPAFDKMAYRGGSGGVLLVIPFVTRSLDDLPVGDRSLIAVVDGVEKPGNLGAILRTADAAGLDALLLTDTEAVGTDIHNPNVIRASLGAIFTVPVVTTTRERAVSWFQEHNITSTATTPAASSAYTAVSYTGPTAIVMGSEASGLSREWLDAVDVQVRIPMAGEVDSLNLSVATALMLYEAVRQRNERI